MNEIAENPSVDQSEDDSRAFMHKQCDLVEEYLATTTEPEYSTAHFFTPGLYIRRFIMEPGVYTSKEHKSEHPFAVMWGRCSVKDTIGGAWEEIQGPFLGITKPGTRRIIRCHEQACWVTFHPTTETDLVKIEAQLIEPRERTLKLSENRRSAHQNELR